MYLCLQIYELISKYKNYLQISLLDLRFQHSGLPARLECCMVRVVW